MTQEHPITPPPELVQQWYDNMGPDPGPFESFANAAARWGADQELEACCELLVADHWETLSRGLRTARRTKPPSLKEQALQALAELAAECYGNTDQSDTIRRALEKLDD
jgi:hypothetical protein